MKTIEKEQLSDVSGGFIIAALTSSVTSALKYEFGRQAVLGFYQAGGAVVDLFASATPVPTHSFYLRDFNVPASTIAAFAMGAAAGIGMMKLSQD